MRILSCASHRRSRWHTGGDTAANVARARRGAMLQRTTEIDSDRRTRSADPDQAQDQREAAAPCGGTVKGSSGSSFKVLIGPSSLARGRLEDDSALLVEQHQRRLGSLLSGPGLDRLQAN